MKKIVLSLFVLCLITPNAYALKYVSYDENGNRVYQTVTPENKSTLLGNQETKTRTYVYDQNGKHIKTYSSPGNNRTYVYNENGKRIRTYSSPGNNRTYVYDANGNRVQTYSYAKNGRTYVYDADGKRIKTYSSVVKPK